MMLFGVDDCQALDSELISELMWTLTDEFKIYVDEAGTITQVKEPSNIICDLW